ncbi:hypothetical protein DFH29DRAFT_878497 [Suillus ampliporus]|nr:hypothetical protein DFH29DRAFT_878497 [Suillus ampliporus]
MAMMIIMPELKSKDRPTNGAAQVQCPYLANTTSVVHQNAAAAMQIDPARRGEKGDWKEFIHPSGAMYYYNEKKRTYTKMDIDTLLVEGEEVYPYYYVVPESKIITWVEPMDGYILFQECTAAWHWNHKRLELEAQYWMEMRISEVRSLRMKLNWYRVEALAMEQSTAATIFWTLDQMKEMAAELAIARTETLTGPNGMVEEPGIAICDAVNWKVTTGHHEYLNHYGQPEARLI